MPSSWPACPAGVLALILMCGWPVLGQELRPGVSRRAATPPALSTARLIAAPEPRNGVWTAGVEIALRADAHTYWRNPGEAGVPPRFDFSSSSNVAHVDVSFPAPTRIVEAGSEAIGYKGEVVLPLRVTPIDPGTPSVLRMRMDYAACAEICLPARADVSLPLPPPSEAADSARIAQARSAVPERLGADAASKVASLRREPGQQATWIVEPAAAFQARDVFAEGPDGFYLATRREADGFRITVLEHPPGRPVPEALRLTMVGAAKSVEFEAATKE